MINRLNDFYFKYLMGSEKNKSIALNFINAALATKESFFTDIIYVNKDQEPEHQEEKESRLDVKGVLNDGTVVELEMQATKDPYMTVRSLYYWARMYGDQLVVGEEYKGLKSAVSINVLGYSNKDEDTWHNEYRVLNIENHKELTDHLRIVFLDLVKFEARRVQEMSDLELWGAFFSRKVSDEQLMEVQIMADAMIAEKYFTADAVLRYKYEQREKFARDQRSRENYALEKGLKEGREEGLKEGREEEKNRGIVKMISTLREFDIPEAAIMQKIMEKYNLDFKEAEKYMKMPNYYEE